MTNFSEHPTASIPGACNGWAETQAAYRFLAHEDIESTDILEPHFQNTCERIKAHPTVLCIQDTTELDYNGQQINGLGRLSYDAQRGMYVHPTYVVTPDRVPLGLLNVQMYAREEKKDKAPEKTAGAETKKESARWIEGYEHIAEKAKEFGSTRLIYVADREGDISELMRSARDKGYPADWLIRSQHNRVLPKPAEVKLWEMVEAEEPIVEICFTLKSRRKGKKNTARKARQVQQKVYVKRVTLPDGKGGELDVTCLIAKEGNPPAGEEPVVWRLITNRNVTTLEEAIEIIEWYRARWEIEMFFDILKNGCRVEELQLSTIERVECALALYLIVSWRISHLMRMGRSCPEMDARLLFDHDEIEAIYLMSAKSMPEIPTLNEVIHLVAKLGGFLGRKSDGEPGNETIWIGLQRLVYFVAGMQAARKNCV